MGKKIKKSLSSSKWKQVCVEGSMLGEDLEGFAGLEVLENYDAGYLAGNLKGRNKIFLSNELDGDIYESNSSGGRKRKDHDEDDEDDEENKESNDKQEEKKVIEQPKKKKSKVKAKKEEIETIPGKYVLLNPPEEEDIFANAENAEIKATWNKIGVMSDEIVKALVEKKFTTPTEIQRLTVPVSAFAKCDILGAAETGSGKTLAFGLPIVQSIQRRLKEHEDEAKDLFALILTPTRELAQQIHDHLKAIAKYTDVKIACIIGGLATVKQERVLNSNPHLIIGTPGRIWELHKDGNAHLQKLLQIKHLVIDETDRMIQKGHFAELEHILELLNSDESNQTRQTFVFSATLTMIHELPEYVMKRKKKFIRPQTMTKEQRIDTFVSMFGMKNPKVFDITVNSGVAEKVVGKEFLIKMY